MEDLVKFEDYSLIEDAVNAFKHGEMVVIVDDKDREDEGDLVMGAEFVKPESINFITLEARGLLCVSITEKRAEELKLEYMVSNNTAFHNTPFTVSVDYKHGTTTGISAFDRAATIKALVESTNADDFAKPGHIFPLVSKNGGVLKRAGHTEAVADLAKLAGVFPAGVLCEILDHDGSMAKGEKLLNFARKHKLRIITIADLIQFRRRREKLVEVVSIVDMPTKYGSFKLHLYKNQIDPLDISLALVKGTISKDKPTLVRVHSECLTGDIFGSKRCDCGDQLEAAFKLIEKEDSGVILYMRQEGRGIGLVNKILAYKLQDNGKDTVEANEQLGFKADLREYGIGAQILTDLGLGKIKLLTNNPKKIIGLNGFDLDIVERIPLEIKPDINNKKYLETKRNKLGHLLNNL